MKPNTVIKPILAVDTSQELVTKQRIGIHLPNRGIITMPLYTKLSPVEINGNLIAEGPLRMEVAIEDIKQDDKAIEFVIVARRKMSIPTGK